MARFPTWSSCAPIWITWCAGLKADRLERLLSEALEYGVSEAEARQVCPWAFPEPEKPPEPRTGMAFAEDRQWSFTVLSLGADREQPRPLAHDSLLVKLAEFALID